MQPASQEATEGLTWRSRRFPKPVSAQASGPRPGRLQGAGHSLEGAGAGFPGFSERCVKVTGKGRARGRGAGGGRARHAPGSTRIHLRKEAPRPHSRSIYSSGGSPPEQCRPRQPAEDEPLQAPGSAPHVPPPRRVLPGLTWPSLSQDPQELGGEQTGSHRQELNSGNSFITIMYSRISCSEPMPESTSERVSGPKDRQEGPDTWLLREWQPHLATKQGQSHVWCDFTGLGGRQGTVGLGQAA